MLSHIQGKSKDVSRNADFGAAFDELLSRIPARSQIILMMDVFEINMDLLERSLSRARNSKHQLLVLALDDPDESIASHLTHFFHKPSGTLVRLALSSFVTPEGNILSIQLMGIPTDFARQYTSGSGP